MYRYIKSFIIKMADKGSSSNGGGGVNSNKGPTPDPKGGPKGPIPGTGCFSLKEKQKKKYP